MRSIGPDDANRMQTGGEAVVIDVRGHDEHAMARIPGALHVPLDELQHRLDELPRDRVLVMQCASGGRSAYACQMLAAHHADARNLVGGIMAWARAGLPLERGA